MGAALERVKPEKVLHEMKEAAVPAMRDFALAAGGYVTAEYTARTLMPRFHPLLQGICQGVLGLAGVVIGQQARIPWLETFGFGYGTAGAVRIGRHLASKLLGGEK